MEISKEMLNEVYKMAQIALGKQITIDCTKWAIEEVFFDNFVALYKAGYKQVAKDCVVLTSRELADSMGESCRQSNKIVVRKVLDKIKFLVEERNGSDIEDLSVDGTILEEVLDEVAKDYGV